MYLIIFKSPPIIMQIQMVIISKIYLTEPCNQTLTLFFFYFYEFTHFLDYILIKNDQFLL